MAAHACVETNPATAARRRRVDGFHAGTRLAHALARHDASHGAGGRPPVVEDNEIAEVRASGLGLAIEEHPPPAAVVRALDDAAERAIS